MHERSSILGGAILLTAANLLLRVISIAFNVFLSKQIGANGLGLLQLISTVGLFVALLGTSGVRVAAMNLSAEEFGHRRLGGVRAAMSACLCYGTLISSFVGLLTWIFADNLATAWLHDSRATLSIQCLGIFLPFSCLCGIMTGYYTACARIKQLVVIEIAERLLCMGITVLLLLTWAKGDLSRSCCAIGLGSSLGAAFDFFLLYWRYRRDLRGVPPHRGLGIRKRLVRLCVPLAMNDYLRSGLNTAEQLLIPYGLARYAGSTQQALADYGIIHAMVFPVLMFPAAILYSLSDLLVPELSRARVMKRRLRIVDLTDKCLRLCMLFAGAVSGLLFLCADELGLAIYDSREAGYFLRIFAPMIWMLYLDAIVDGMLKGLAEQVSCVRYNTLTSLLDVLFLLLLLPRIGIAGYVLSFAVTHAVNLWLSLRRLLRVTRYRVRLLDFCKPLLCLLFSLVLAGFAPMLRGLFFLVFLCASYTLLEVLSARDRSWLRRVFQNSNLMRSSASSKTASQMPRK